MTSRRRPGRIEECNYAQTSNDYEKHTHSAGVIAFEVAHQTAAAAFLEYLGQDGIGLRQCKPSPKHICQEHQADYSAYPRSPMKPRACRRGIVEHSAETTSKR